MGLSRTSRESRHSGIGSLAAKQRRCLWTCCRLAANYGRPRGPRAASSIMWRHKSRDLLTTRCDTGKMASDSFGRDTYTNSVSDLPSRPAPAAGTCSNRTDQAAFGLSPSDKTILSICIITELMSGPTDRHDFRPSRRFQAGVDSPSSHHAQNVHHRPKRTWVVALSIAYLRHSWR